MLSCREFVDSLVRPQLFARAYNLANFMRRPALPEPLQYWSLTALREKLVKIGTRVVRRARCIRSQMGEPAVPSELCGAILERTQAFRPS
ncbi:MAG: transposase [Planctomycetota bacterium]